MTKNLLKIEHWYYYTLQSSINNSIIIFQVWLVFEDKVAHKNWISGFLYKVQSFCSKFKWFKLQNSSYIHIAIKKNSAMGIFG
jgi:hypothetical protein